jgi:hypothetical protein
MSVKFLVIFSLLFLLCTNSFAQIEPDQFALSVRQLPSGEYEAVMIYGTDVFCFLAVTPASSVEIVGSEVTIKSPESDEPIYCITPPPPYQFFEETALIGELGPGNYTVSWIQPEAFSLSIPLRVGVPGDSPIPSNSTWALALLILGVLAVAHFTPRLRVRSGPR